MAYATTAQVKEYLGIADTADDSLISRLLDSATAFIDGYTGFTFSSVRSVKRFGFYEVYRGEILLPECVLNFYSVKLDGVELTDFVKYPLQSPHSSVYHPEFRNLSRASVVEIDADWGYSSIPPADIVHATIRLAGYYYRQRDAQTYDTTAIPEVGVMTIPKGIPADVKMILDKYKRLA